MHYQTAQMYFDSETLQTIIQTLAQMDAVIIVPREQISYGGVKELSSRSIIDDDQPWAVLDWKNSDEIPMPPIREKLLLRISSPIVQKAQLGEPVFKHSEHYLLAEETMSLEGLSLTIRSTLDALRRNYIKWKAYYSRCVSQRNNLRKEQPTLSAQRDVCRELRLVIENKTKSTFVNYDMEIKRMLQSILDSEYLETNGLYLARFDSEMLFFSPEKSVAQAFLDEMPCSPRLDAIRKCIQDYIDGKTDIIHSADKW